MIIHNHVQVQVEMANSVMSLQHASKKPNIDKSENCNKLSPLILRRDSELLGNSLLGTFLKSTKYDPESTLYN